MYGRLESEEEVNARFDRCDAEMAELNKQWRKEDEERIVNTAVENVRKMKMGANITRIGYSSGGRRPRTWYSLYSTERPAFDSDTNEDTKPLYDMRVECSLAEHADE